MKLHLRTTTSIKYTKRLLVTILVLFCCQQGFALTDEEVALMNVPGRVVPLADCDEIDVHAASGWWLRIGRDGSADLGFGSTPTDMVQLPTGSFSFAGVHKKVSALKFDGIGASRDPSVGFHEQGAKITHGMSTTDHQAVKELFPAARGHAEDFDATWRLAKIWSEKPPEP